MAIPLVKEPEEESAIWGNLIEKCVFCGTQTRFWHENTNTPVCESCAKTHKVAELEDHGQNVRKLNRLLRKNSSERKLKKKLE